MDSSTELLWLAHAPERSLSYHVLTALGIGSIGIGKQRTVLVGDEETRRNGVDSYSLAKLLGTLVSHVFGEVGDAGLGCRIATHAGQRAESCHRGEVDNRAHALCHHRFEKHLGGDDGAYEVQIEYALELGWIQIEEVLFGADCGSLLVASGCIEKRVDRPYSATMASQVA